MACVFRLLGTAFRFTRPRSGSPLCGGGTRGRVQELRAHCAPALQPAGLYRGPGWVLEEANRQAAGDPHAVAQRGLPRARTHRCRVDHGHLPARCRRSWRNRTARRLVRYSRPPSAACSPTSRLMEARGDFPSNLGYFAFREYSGVEMAAPALGRGIPQTPGRPAARFRHQQVAIGRHPHPHVGDGAQKPLQRQGLRQRGAAEGVPAISLSAATCRVRTSFGERYVPDLGLGSRGRNGKWWASHARAEDRRARCPKEQCLPADCAESKLLLRLVKSRTRSSKP